MVKKAQQTGRWGGDGREVRIENTSFVVLYIGPFGHLAVSYPGATQQFQYSDVNKNAANNLDGY